MRTRVPNRDKSAGFIRHHSEYLLTWLGSNNTEIRRVYARMCLLQTPAETTETQTLYLGHSCYVSHTFSADGTPTSGTHRTNTAFDIVMFETPWPSFYQYQYINPAEVIPLTKGSLNLLILFIFFLRVLNVVRPFQYRWNLHDVTAIQFQCVHTYGRSGK